MKQALLLLVAAAAATLGAVAWSGLARTISAGFGAVSAMAALIAATFLWLWWVRATPLALGMVLSWAGVALLSSGLAVAGWGVNRMSIVALPLIVAGVILHFAVMRSSMKLGPWAAAGPFISAVLGAFAAGMITNS